MSYSGPPPVPPHGSGDEPPSPYGTPPADSPYGVPSGSTGTPYGAPSQGPYGAPAPSQDPYGAPPSAYGTPPPTSYGTPAPMYGSVSPYATATNTQANGLGVTALILSILGFLCGGVFAIVGLILAIQSRKAVAEGRANNSGLGTAALVISIVALSIWALVWLGALASN